MFIALRGHGERLFLPPVQCGIAGPAFENGDMTGKFVYLIVRFSIGVGVLVIIHPGC